MKKLWQTVGHLAFWFVYPASWVYLRIGSRTRVLVVVDDQVLLVKGWLGSNRWQLPGGGVHRGEDHKTGARRELQEEAGVSLLASQLEFFYSTQLSDKGLKFKYDCFYAELPKKPELSKQKLEITELAWLQLKDVNQKNATKDTCQAVQDWLKR